MKKNYVVHIILLVFLSLALPSILIAESNTKKSDQSKKSDQVKKRDSASNGKVSGKDIKSSLYLNKVMANLTKEELGKLRELQKSDPMAFRQEILKIVKRYKQAHLKRDPELHSLTKSYNAASDEDKVKIKQKITAIVRQQFNKKMELNRKSYERARKKLQELEAKLIEREDNAEMIIKARVEELTKNPALSW